MDMIKTIRAEIERLRELNAPKDSDNKIDEIAGQGYDDCLDDVENFLDTLEEPDFPATDEEMEAFLASHPKVEVPEKYKTPDWLYKESEQEPEVDLEKEADRMFFSLGWYEGDHHQPMLDCVSLDQFRGIARHFYDLGLKNAK